MTQTGHSRELRDRLRARRRALKWSQERLAARLAEELAHQGGDAHVYSKQQISNWEKFKSHPPIDVFAAWARALGMRLVVDLQGDTGAALTAVMVPRRAVAAVQAVASMGHSYDLLERLARLIPQITEERAARILDGDIARWEEAAEVRRLLQERHRSNG